MDIKLGKYKHFKGNMYEVIGIAKHSETCEEYVVYKSIFKEQEIWIRPKEMFMEKVEKDGTLISRFEYMGE